MTEPRSATASRFEMALKLIFAALLAPSLSTDARAADWRIAGVYAHEAKHWDTNVGKQFPLVVFRYYTGQPVKPQIEAIRELAESGNRVIVNFEFMANAQQRKSLEAPPPFYIIKSKLLTMLNGLEDIRVEAISLDEENDLSDSKIEYLNGLYQAAKQHSPRRKFVQWIVFRKKGGQIQFQGIDSLDTGIDSLDTDGWIIDPYLSSEKDYGLIVDALKETSRPIYSVVWAAPGWNTSAGYRVHAQPNWWNGSQWKNFYNRLAVNQKNNVSTIFYLYGLDKKNVRSLWVGNSCDRKFFRDLVNITLPYYRTNNISPTTPASRPPWIPAYCE